MSKAEKEAERFNERYPVGTRVRIWPARREGEGIETTTRSEASIMGGTAVVWTEARSSCIALSHVEPVGA